MSQLRLFLFGSPRLERDGEPVDISLRKALALLAYLAVTEQSHSRDALATLFWPDDDQRKARGNLRRALSRINTAIGKGQLETDRERAGLNPKADLWLDVDHFQRHLAECQTHDHPPNEVCADCVPPLTKAVSSYTNDFLAGFTLPDCPDFDEWQFFQSEGLRQALASALERLVQGLSTQSDYELAIPYARRRLALDSLHEPAHRQLMELYAHNGQPSAAIRQYRECEQILDEELGISPSKETTALFEAIKAKRLSAPIGAEEQGSRGAGGIVQHSPLSPGPSAPPHNLPPQPTPFIGREAELAALDDLIANPDVRLVTILGPGGIGKTRLSIQAATESLHAFADGVYFVPLAPISSDEFLVTAIAEALGISFYGATDPKVQLLQQLRNRRSLLILDNFEHVLEGAILLSEMALAAPDLKLLVTSREHLNLQEEWLYDLQGLAFPAATDQTSKVLETFEVLEERYSALQLFEQRARQIQANFDPDAEYPAVVRICQLVNGMPLGLELAATWVKLISCQEIAAEIEKNLDFLTTSMRNVPERHRSLRAVFRHSWQLLSDEEQDVFKKLSAFRGGFLYEAAAQVAGTSLPLLASLMDKSLLRRRENGRYEIHELLRQYAAEKLQEGGEDETIQERHSDYFTEFLHQREADLKGSRLHEGLAAITADIDNIRAAWQWAIINGNDSAISKSWESLFWYNETLGNFQESESAFRRAVTAVGGEPPVVKEKSRTTAQKILLGQLLGVLGSSCFRLGKYRENQVLIQQSVSLLRETGPEAKPALGLALYFLGGTQAVTGAYETGIRYAQESLSIYSELGDKFGQGIALIDLGNLSEFQGNYTGARTHYWRCIELMTQIGELRLKVVAINGLGRVALTLGLYDEAEQQLKTGYQMRQESGDRFGIALSLPPLGRLPLVRGELTEAEQRFEELRHLSQELNHPLTLGYSLAGLGTLARLRGAYEEAEPLLEENLAMQKEQGRKLDIADCLNDLGRLAFDRGDYEQARQLHQESLAIYQELNQKTGLASTLGYLGQVAMAMGRRHYPKARQYFRQALEITNQTEVAPIALDVLRGCAALLLSIEPTNDESVQAIELLALVQHHPASEYETREKARRLLAEWVAAHSPEVVEAAQTRGRALDLWETAAKLLEALTKQGRGSEEQGETSAGR